VDAVGLSNVCPAEIREAQALVPVATVQNAFSVWEAGVRRPPLLDLCEREGMVLMAYAPLGGRRRALELSERPALAALAEELDASPQELALAWLLRQSRAIVPIPGTTRGSRLDSIVRSATLELDEEAGRRLEAAVRELSGGHLVGRLAARLVRPFRR
jgi:aryl-alcohol dehydrogenase-like predicted oxidoreductase